jgi:hypothetical protein
MGFMRMLDLLWRLSERTSPKVWKGRHSISPYSRARRMSSFYKREKALVDMARAELVFVNILRRPGIDSQPGGSVPPPYLLYTARQAT